MTTITFDSAALGINFLIIFLSLLVGVLGGIAGALASGFGALAFGVDEAIAGGRQSNRYESHRNKGAVFLRAILWFTLICASFALVLSGWTWVGHICAIVGSVCLPIAVIKLIRV